MSVTYGKALAAVDVLLHVGVRRSLRAVSSQMTSERSLDHVA